MGQESIKRINRVLLLFLGVGIAAVGLLVLKPPCLIRSVFGVLCPSCGTTRMVSALLRFDFVKAWQLNPFMLFFLPFAALWGVLEAVRYVKGETPLILKRFSVVLWALWLILAVAFGVCRNLF